MRSVMKRGALCLGVAMTVILGGGFASADYGPGNADGSADVDVTYTIVSFRAIELDDSADMTEGVLDFGAVRQGQIQPLSGPYLLYATTWASDQIAVSMTDPSLTGIDLNIVASELAEPSDGMTQCDAVGTAASEVTLTISDQPLITGITDCGAAANVDYTADPPDYEADLSATTWATAATTITVDASTATSDEDYTDPVSTTLTFTIKAGGD